MTPPDVLSVERLRAWVHQNAGKEHAATLDALIQQARSDRAMLTKLRLVTDELCKVLNDR